MYCFLFCLLDIIMASCFLLCATALGLIVQQAFMVDLIGIENVFQGMGILIFAIGIGQISGPPLAGRLSISKYIDLLDCKLEKITNLIN